MKKLLLIAIIIFSVMGCSSAENAENKGNDLSTKDLEKVEDNSAKELAVEFGEKLLAYGHPFEYTATYEPDVEIIFSYTDKNNYSYSYKTTNDTENFLADEGTYTYTLYGDDFSDDQEKLEWEVAPSIFAELDDSLIHIYDDISYIYENIDENTITYNPESGIYYATGTIHDEEINCTLYDDLSQLILVEPLKTINIKY